MSHFGKNIKKIRTVKNLSQQNFADLFMLKRATLGAYEEGRSEPKIENIIKVANYFSISIDDLLTRDLTVNELLKFKGGITTDLTSLIKEKFKTIPCITESTEPNYILNNGNESYLNQLPTITLPINDDENYIGYSVRNLEMSTYNNGLFPNDIVIGKSIPLKELNKIENGTLVLTHTNNKLILRRLFSNDNKFTLKADHKNIEDIELDLSKLKQIWLMTYVFIKRIPDNQNNIDGKLSSISTEISKINRKLGN